MEPSPTGPDEGSIPFTVGRTPSWWGAWAALAIVALVLVPALVGGPREGRSGAAEAWRLAQACFYAQLLVVLAYTSLVGRRRVRFEADELVFPAGAFRRDRRVRVDEIDHAFVGIDEQAVFLVARRAEEGVVLPSVPLRRLTESEGDRVRRWFARRVPLRAADGDAVVRRWTGGRTSSLSSDRALRIGVPVVTRRDAGFIAVASAALALAFVGAAAWRGVPTAPVAGALAVAFAVVASLPAGVRTLEPDAIRWRRTLWSPERRLPLAEVSHVEERLDGTLVFVAKAPPGRVVGPRFVFSSVAPSDEALVKRWIGARLPVRGYHGDRVPWAERRA